MACNITLAGLTRDCKNSQGGIKEVYISDYANVKAISYDTNKTTISAITMTASTTFHTYKFRKQTASMTTTIDNTESPVYTTELSLKFSKMETVKRVEISALAQGEMSVIVRDTNNQYWYLGKDYPVVMSAGTINSGTNLTDFQGYEITLQDISIDSPMQVATASLSTILDGNQTI